MPLARSAAGRFCALSAVLACLLGIAAPPPVRAEPVWTRLSPGDQLYTVFLPAPPERFRTATWTPLGSFATVGYEMRRARDGCDFTTTELPAVVRWLGGADIVYERSRKSFLAENEARASVARDTVRDGVAGHVLEWSSADRHGRTEFYLLADRLHIFNCFAAAGTPLALADDVFARLALRAATSAQ